ncbi:hypothetical protein KP509_20G039200 [Ceratopteris richardii]|uniref:FAF domain-containing protein n=1 Tax=Ceratopteris richardii TaxID=49495 RepID=A0A8T2SIF6_CERRI|nr:hypothetical protein KP509_20G039200 [Ceratopteris richardii]
MTGLTSTQLSSIFEPLIPRDMALFSSIFSSHDHSIEMPALPCTSDPCSTHSDASFNMKLIGRAPYAFLNVEKDAEEYNSKDIINKNFHGGIHGLRGNDNPYSCNAWAILSILDKKDTSAPAMFLPSIRSVSMSNMNTYSNGEDADDDGSVGKKLIGCMTKSISNPSLLSYCKEPVGETPYQKSVRLKKMNLHHCTEELGSESHNSQSPWSHVRDNASSEKLPNEISFINLHTKKSLSRSATDSTLSGIHQQENVGNADCSTVSAGSLPRLCKYSAVTSKYSCHTRDRSFPPPISHILPSSLSSDTLGYALRSCRKQGHLLLREVQVSPRKYFKADRSDGRLTLQLLVAEDDCDEQDTGQEKMLDAAESPQFDFGMKHIWNRSKSEDASSDGEIVAQFPLRNESEEESTIIANPDKGRELREMKNHDHIPRIAIKGAISQIEVREVSALCSMLIPDVHCARKANTLLSPMNSRVCWLQSICATRIQRRSSASLNRNEFPSMTTLRFELTRLLRRFCSRADSSMSAFLRRLNETDPYLLAPCTVEWRRSAIYRFPLSALMTVLKYMDTKSPKNDVSKVIWSTLITWTGSALHARKVTSLGVSQRATSKVMDNGTIVALNEKSSRCETDDKESILKCGHSVARNVRDKKLGRSWSTAEVPKLEIVRSANVECHLEPALLLQPDSHSSNAQDSEYRDLRISELNNPVITIICHLNPAVLDHFDWIYGVGCKDQSYCNKYATIGSPYVAITS